VRLVDYTSDVERLREAILKLGVRAETPVGGVAARVEIPSIGEKS
jgi:hypothetical protein